MPNGKSSSWIEIGSITALIVGLFTLDAYGFLSPLNIIMIFDYTLPQFIFFSLIILGVAVILLNGVLRIGELIQTKKLGFSDLKEASVQLKKDTTDFLQSFSQMNEKEANRFADDQMKQFGEKSKQLAKSGLDQVKEKKFQTQKKPKTTLSPKKAKVKKVNVMLPDGVVPPEAIKAEFMALLGSNPKAILAMVESGIVIPAIHSPSVKYMEKISSFQWRYFRRVLIIGAIGLVVYFLTQGGIA